MLVGIKPLVDAGVTRDGGRALSAAWNLNARGRSPGGGGVLKMMWENTEFSVPFTVEK